MPKKPRSKQEQEMEDALDRLFATPVPEKDTGPDPLDILALDQPAAATPAAGKTARRAVKAADKARAGTSACQVELDAADRLRANMLIDRLDELTGEHHDLATALRVALHACPLDLAQIGPVFEALAKPAATGGKPTRSAKPASPAKRPARKNKAK
jgi:hypothetical protein